MNCATDDLLKVWILMDPANFTTRNISHVCVQDCDTRLQEYRGLVEGLGDSRVVGSIFDPSLCYDLV